MFLQYLWGIETHKPLPIPQLGHYRFYSTYEELKPVLPYIIYEFIISFYSTYEELKHV